MYVVGGFKRRRRWCSARLVADLLCRCRLELQAQLDNLGSGEGGSSTWARWMDRLRRALLGVPRKAGKSRNLKAHNMDGFCEKMPGNSRLVQSDRRAQEVPNVGGKNHRPFVATLGYSTRLHGRPGASSLASRHICKNVDRDSLRRPPSRKDSLPLRFALPSSLPPAFWLILTPACADVDGTLSKARQVRHLCQSPPAAVS